MHWREAIRSWKKLKVLGENFIVDVPNNFALLASGFFGQLVWSPLAGQIKTIFAKNQFNVFDLIGFVSVPNEFVIALKVEKGISYDLSFSSMQVHAVLNVLLVWTASAMHALTSSRGS
jgi:hypothetical protein